MASRGSSPSSNEPLVQGSRRRRAQRERARQAAENDLASRAASRAASTAAEAGSAVFSEPGDASARTIFGSLIGSLKSIPGSGLKDKKHPLDYSSGGHSSSYRPPAVETYIGSMSSS